MARIEVSGMDALLAGIYDMAEKTPQLRIDILEAEADVIEPALRRSIVDERLVRTGKLLRSIRRRKVKHFGAIAICIGPTGEHHRYLPSDGKSGIVSAGRVGYIGEYGIKSRGIRGREWLKKGIEKSKNQAFDAADVIYDNYMKNNNL
ncbi:MAG: hypothetical protein ACI3VZ_08215 [Faecousia sp.]